MSQSRVEKVGTVYSRAKALYAAGVIKKDAKPMWMDVYEAHPPKYEPRWDRLPTKTSKIPDIWYAEDAARAEFHRRFGQGAEVHDLVEGRHPSICQRFVDAFKDSSVEDFEERFEEALEAVRNDVDGLNPEGARFAFWGESKTRHKSDESKKLLDSSNRDAVKMISFKQLFAESQD